MRIACVSLFLLGICFIPGWIKPNTPSAGVAAVLNYFKTEAPVFSGKCTALLTAVRAINTDDAHAVDQAREQLADCRSHYKKIESFLEYFFRDAARAYNTPPKFEGEEPFMEYQDPIGLQVIESLLYEKDPKQHYQELLQQAEAVENSSEGLLPLLFDFQPGDDQVLESFRLELIRVMTLGITGYDAPLLKTGIQESYIAMVSLKDQLHPWLLPGEPESDSLAVCLDSTIACLQISVRSHTTSTSQLFDQFDRLAFLKEYALPLQHYLGAFIRMRHLDINTNGVLNYQADDLFSPDALNASQFPHGILIKGDPARLLYLGKILFTEPALSGNGRKSCASCHHPEKMFTDGLSKSLAFNEHSSLDRNAPTLLYCGFQYSQFWDGRVRTLEDQIRTVLSDKREMNTDTATAVQILAARKPYDSLFRRTFEDQMGQESPETSHEPSVIKQASSATNQGSPITLNRIICSLAAYVRSLHPMNSPFDQYIHGKTTAMTLQAIRGANLFLGKAQCATCHFMPLFNGLIPPDYKFTEFEVLGTTSSEDLEHPTLSNDQGKFVHYALPFMKGAFKTPTVRNAAGTGPYMHNGAFNSLEKVMDFYNRGGGAGLGLQVPQQTLPERPLQLTKGEISDIIYFMHALTDSISVSPLPRHT